MQCQIAVTAPQPNPEDIQEWADFLIKRGYSVRIKESNTKFSLYRNVLEGECDIPRKNYWIVRGNTFDRNEKMAQESFTKQKCICCGRSIKAQGKHRFCDNCRKMANEDICDGAFNLQQEHSKKRKKI